MPEIREPAAPKLSLYKQILYSEAEVDARIAEMATDICRIYKGTDTLFVSLLNGAQPFTAKLMRAIQHHDPYFHPNVQSMIVSRYGMSRDGGTPHLVTDLPPDYRVLDGRHVVLLDDLVDGGGTTDFTEHHLYSYGAATIERIVLVKKLKKPPIRGKSRHVRLRSTRRLAHRHGDGQCPPGTGSEPLGGMDRNSQYRVSDQVPAQFRSIQSNTWWRPAETSAGPVGSRGRRGIRGRGDRGVAAREEWCAESSCSTLFSAATRRW